MAGLMGEKIAPQDRARERGASDPANTTGQQPNVSPEEQDAYNTFVGQALNLIYDDKAMPAIMERLKATGDPLDNLANTAVMVVMRVQESAKKAGKEIPGDVLYHGGIEVLEDLANLSEEAGIHTYKQDELEGATYRALDLYREMASKAGLIDEGPLKQEFGMLMQADKAGQLDEVIPGIEKAKGGA